MGLLVGTRRVFLLVGSFMLFVSAILTTCSMATNVWYWFDAPSAANVPRWILAGTNQDTNITFYQETYGLWTSCVYSPNWRYFTCGLIDLSCTFGNCWTINGVLSCNPTSVDVLGSCQAFNAVRILVPIALVLYVLGTVLFITSLCSEKTRLALVGCVFGYLGMLLNMIGFAIHMAKLHNGPTKTGAAISTYYGMGWGLILIVTAWPVALVGAVLGTFGYVAGKQTANDVWDNQDDNYVYGDEYEDGDAEPDETSDADGGGYDDDDDDDDDDKQRFGDDDVDDPLAPQDVDETRNMSGRQGSAPRPAPLEGVISPVPPSPQADAAEAGSGLDEARDQGVAQSAVADPLAPQEFHDESSERESI